MNVGDLGKVIVAKCFKTCPKSNKLPNLVTLLGIHTENDTDKKTWLEELGEKE